MNILEKIVSSNRLPVLFIGSGISKRYLENYPSWPELLKLSFDKVCADDYKYYGLINQYKRQGLSEFDINTQLASEIEILFNTAFYNHEIRINNVKNPSWVKKNISPYKMFLSFYFKKMKLISNRHLSLELEEFKKLKNKVSAVITTNYDTFLEQHIFPNDFTVFTRQNQLFSADSYNVAEIYKIHGSVTDAESIVITKNDYDNFNDSRKLIIAKMLTLFADSPIIFMGYSFTDEDVQNVISDFLSCLTAGELKNIETHFVFISYKKGERRLIECKRSITTKSGTVIPFTEIETDNFLKIFQTLNSIVPGISPKRIRETKRLVKNIVDSNVNDPDANSVIIGINDLDNIDLSNKPLAIAIGYRENILSTYGYSEFPEETIIEDILYNNKHLDSDAMCLKKFHSLKITRVIPVFKYIRYAKQPIPADSHLQKFADAHNSYDKIISNKAIKTYNNYPRFTNLSDLKDAICAEPNVYKKYGLLMVNLRNFDISDIKLICQNLFTENSTEATKSPTFKRCVMYIDFIENYNKKG